MTPQVSNHLGIRNIDDGLELAVVVLIHSKVLLRGAFTERKKLTTI
jgi:hypothetical protein